VRSPAISASRTLTVFCNAGLVNRLRVLVSGLTLAEVSGRTFRLLWPRSPACGAAFRELFTNSWPVDDVEALAPALEAHQVRDRGLRATVGLLDDPRPHIVLGTSSWLVPTGRTWPALRDRCAELLAGIAPVPPLAERIAEFRARHFRPVMIGVHLRRGDFYRLRPEAVGNAAAAVAAVDRFLARRPDAGILLCTDDGAPDRKGARREGLRELFATRYGERMVFATPRSLDRRTVEGVQDALVEFQLLRATQMVVGTTGSSFSHLAVFGRDVSHVLVGGGQRGDRRISPAAQLALVHWHWLVRRVLRVGHGSARSRLP
jgi:hypothetical protein